MTYNEALRVVLDAAKAVRDEDIEIDWREEINEAIRVLESTHEAELTRNE